MIQHDRFRRRVPPRGLAMPHLDRRGLLLGLGATTLVASLGHAASFPPALGSLIKSEKVGILGDSRAAANHWPFDTSGTPTVPTALMPAGTREDKPTSGFACFLEQMCGGRVTLPRSLNYGVSAETSVAIANRAAAAFAAMKAGGASTAIVPGATTNDRSGGLTYATSEAAVLKIAAAARAARIRLIWIAEYPRGNAGTPGNRLAGTVLADHQRIRRLILSLHDGVELFAVDAWPALADPASATGDILAAAAYDALHLQGEGNQRVAAALSPTVNQIFAPRFLAPASNADVWSANNPNGFSVANPMLRGAAGTKLAVGGVTGSLADGWGQGTSLPTGLAVQCNKGPGDAYQEFVLSGTPTAGFPNFDLLRKDITPGTQGLVIGGRVGGLAEIEVLAGATGLWEVDPYVLVNGGAGRTSRSFAEQSAATSTKWPAAALARGPAILPEIDILSGTSIIRFGLRFYAIQNVAVSATVRVYSAGPTPA